MIDIILNTLTLGLKPVYEKHKKFYDIICNFRNKLPRSQNTARKLKVEELDTHPILSDLKYMTVVDLSTHRKTVGSPFSVRLKDRTFSFGDLLPIFGLVISRRIRLLVY